MVFSPPSLSCMCGAAGRGVRWCLQGKAEPYSWHADTGNWLSGPSKAPATHHYSTVCSALGLVLLTSLHQAPSLFYSSCHETSADGGLCSLLSGAVPNAVPHGSWGRADNPVMVLQNGQQKQGLKKSVTCCSFAASSYSCILHQPWWHPHLSWCQRHDRLGCGE